MKHRRRTHTGVAAPHAARPAAPIAAPPPPRSAAADLARPSPFAGIDVQHLSAGDVAPDWPLSTIDDRPFSLQHDSVAGTTRVLLLAGADDAGDGFERLVPAFESLGARVYVVLRGAPAASRRHCASAASLLVDARGHLAAAFQGASSTPTVVVLRANQHIAAIYRGDAALPPLAEALALCERLRSERVPQAMASHPPVLMIPDVFSRDECRKLIEVYDTRGQVLVQSDQAVDYFGADYKMPAPDHGREDRVDHFFFERATLDFVLHRLRRVELEVSKAFHYRITHHETLRVARYAGARRGEGHGHRDNGPPHEHRRFALSINLNTEDFEGGELRFPEFGDQRYRPDTGMAFVFSSSLLHEAMEVTAGTRYVLLSFMYGAT